MITKRKTSISIILFVLLVAACGPIENKDDGTSLTPDNSTNSSYPVPSQVIKGYPSQQQAVESYPIPVIVDENKRFTIIGPLKAGDTEVVGKGPANISIKVISISFVGEVLGSGVVNDDGTFQIPISVPLEANHIIGLQLSDQSLESSFLDGPDYTNIPMIGLVLTQAVVVEP